MNKTLKIAATVISLMILLPLYILWLLTLDNEAKLDRAKTAVQEAKFLADVDVARAEGTAKAIGIVSKSLKDNDLYLQYEWIKYLREIQVEPKLLKD